MYVLASIHQRANWLVNAAVRATWQRRRPKKQPHSDGKGTSQDQDIITPNMVCSIQLIFPASGELNNIKTCIRVNTAQGCLSPKGLTMQSVIDVNLPQQSYKIAIAAQGLDQLVNR